MAKIIKGEVREPTETKIETKIEKEETSMERKKINRDELVEKLQPIKEEVVAIKEVAAQVRFLKENGFTPGEISVVLGVPAPRVYAALKVDPNAVRGRKVQTELRELSEEIKETAIDSVKNAIIQAGAAGYTTAEIATGLEIPATRVRFILKEQELIANKLI